MTRQKWCIVQRKKLRTKNNKPVEFLDIMKISDDVDYSAIRGMTSELKAEIDNAIHNIQKEYDIKLSSITSGKKGRGDIFGSGPYIDDDGNLKFGLALNSDIDYNRVKQKIYVRYSKGIFAGKSIEDYIAHEMAHIMVYQNCTDINAYNTKKAIIDKLFVAGISGYADDSKSGDESLAEAFVKYRNKEKIPLKAEILIKTYIERWKK